MLSQDQLDGLFVYLNFKGGRFHVMKEWEEA